MEKIIMNDIQEKIKDELVTDIKEIIKKRKEQNQRTSSNDLENEFNKKS